MSRGRPAVRPALGLAVLGALCCTGCPESKPVEVPDAGPPPTEPILPSPTASAEAAALPAWAQRLPKVEPQVKLGDRVWATVPQPGTAMATAAIFTVEGIHDGLLSLTDTMGQGVSGVSPAVVHRAGKRGKLAEGDVVLCYAFTLPGILARVAELEGGKEIQVRYDWAGQTKEAAIFHAEPPREGIKPLAFVGFPKAGATSRGLLVALTESHGWIRTSSGHIEVHERDTISALPLPANKPEVGTPVRAYAWTTGYRRGVVAAELEPGLRYRVKLDGNLGERDYFFSSLLPSR